MFEDSSQKVLEALEKATQRGLFAVGEEWLKNASIIYTNMRIGTKVGTGRLRASLSFLTPEKSDGNTPVASSKAGDQLVGTAPKSSVIVGSNVEYAGWVISGTSRMPARDFFTPSLMTYRKEYEELFKLMLSGEL